MRSPQPTVISLFSGSGGLDIGLERAGWQTVVATDIDPAAVATLKANQAKRIPVSRLSARRHLQEARILHADITDLSASDLRPAGKTSAWRPTLLAGGPPCQPWSSAGLQKGFRDARGLLIAQMVRIAAELRPRFVLMENVRGLLTAVGPRGQNGEALRIIQGAWEKIGYAVSWGLLNAADFGAAQRRVRLVMFASADYALPSFPKPTHGKHGDNGLERWSSLSSIIARIPAGPPEEYVFPAGIRRKELLALEPGTGIRTGGTVEHQRPGGHWGYRQDCFLADPDLPSRTIRAAGTPDWVRVDGAMRRLTWRECAALQGFPAQWEFEGSRDVKFRQIGNAVQTDVSSALGSAILEALAKGPAREGPASVPWPEYFSRRIRGAAADHRANSASRQRRISEAHA